MKKLAHSLAVLSAILLPALQAAPAHASDYHTWVSHNGRDASSCLAIAPCATFAYALTQSNEDGAVGCLDSGSFGPFTITTAVTIDCNGTVGTASTDVAVDCTNEIVVNAPGKVVNLRGLVVVGLTGTDPFCQMNGILIQAATAVYIEDSVIEGFQQKGIVDARTTGLTKLSIKNTIVRNNMSAGIVVGAAPRNSVVLEDVHSVGNAYGIGVATGNNVVISRSVMSENGIAGIEADPGADVVVENTKISHNASYGIFAQGTVTLANSDISFNSSSISGSTFSFDNNRLVGNGAGTAPTPISQQ
jgi:predicted TIM-barrel enzyme